MTVELFGEFGVRFDDGSRAAFESGRAPSVLGFVLLQGEGPCSRQQLAFSLWPDSSESQARTNLRKVLHSLRQDWPGIDTFLEVAPRTLRWRREITGLVDVDEFEAALAAADRAETREATVDALMRAEGLYKSDLLVGCWDEWLIERREHYRDLHLVAVRRLVDGLSEVGRHQEAVRFAREILRAEPLQESSYRSLMRLHRASGDRAAAAHVYHQCVTALRDELGVDPSPETIALYGELTKESTVEETVAPAPARRGEALVGRSEEWDQLASLWPDDGDASARLVMVTGEAGIGKTRLVDAFASWCARRGASVARARSFPTDGDLGFGVVISWLRDRSLHERLGRVVGSDAQVLARLLPELGDDRELPMDYSEQRRRLFDIIARVLSADGDRLTVLVADDAQWADDQSVQAIHHLLRGSPSARLLVVATVRREELTESSLLDRVAAGLLAADRLTEIPLTRFTRRETEALARDHFDGDPTDAGIGRLHADSEGNPLFIVESIRAGWRPDGPDAPVSPKLRGVITDRVAQLTPATRDVLEVAVTVGREFRSDLVAEAAGVDDVAIVRALDELWRRGIVLEYSTDAYDFTHGKIRDVVYAGLSPAARRSNHRRVANTHLTIDANSLDAVSGQVAYHFDQGGLAEDAIAWYQRAARRAQRLYANEEAVRLLDRALELARAMPDADRRLVLELDVLSALPTPLGFVESYSSDRMLQTQQRAVDIATELGVEPHASVLRSLAFMRLCQNQFGESGAIAQRLRRSAVAAGDDNLVLEGDYLLGVVAFWDGSFDSARQQFELVVDHYTPDLRSEHLLRFGQDAQIICRSRLANTLRFLGRVDEAVATRDAAVAEATDLGHPWTLSLTLIFASMLAVDLDDGDRLRGYADVLGGLGIETRANRLHTNAILGAAQAFAGRPSQGIAMIRASIYECGPINPAPGFRSTLWRLLVAAHHAAGGAVDGGAEACDDALQVDGTRIWRTDIERVRSELARSRT